MGNIINSMRKPSRLYETYKCKLSKATVLYRWLLHRASAKSVHFPPGFAFVPTCRSESDSVPES